MADTGKHNSGSYKHGEKASGILRVNPPADYAVQTTFHNIPDGEEVTVYIQVGSEWVVHQAVTGPGANIDLPGDESYFIDMRDVTRNAINCMQVNTCMVKHITSSITLEEEPECIPLPGLMDKTTGGPVIMVKDSGVTSYQTVGKNGGFVGVSAASIVPASSSNTKSKATVCDGAHTFADLIEAATGAPASDPSNCYLQSLDIMVLAPGIETVDGPAGAGYATVSWSGGGETKHFVCAEINLMDQPGRLDCVAPSVLTQNVTLDAGVCIEITAITG